MRFKEFDIHIRVPVGPEITVPQQELEPVTKEPAQKIDNPVTLFPQQQEIEIAKAQLGKADPKIKAQLTQSDSKV